MALRDHLSADIFVAVERERDCLLIPRLQMTMCRQNIKYLHTQRENQMLFRFYSQQCSESQF